MSGADQGLDIYEQHWADQGGHVDQTTAANLDLREHAARETDNSEKTREEVDDVHQSFLAAKTECDRRGEDRATWNRSRETRDWIRDRWAGSGFDDLNKYVANRIQWLEAFQKNPHEAREQWTRYWARGVSPFHFREKDTAKAPEPPADFTDEAKREWQLGEDVRNGVREAARNAADEKLFHDTARMRAIFREKMPGASFDDFLEKCKLVDIHSLENPDNVATRFAQFFGLAATPREAEEQQAAAAAYQQQLLQQQAAYAQQTEQAQAEYQQREQAAETWLNEDVRHRYPDYSLLQDRVGDILEYSKKRGLDTRDPRTWPAIMHEAIQIARAAYRRDQQKAEAENVAKAKRASRSISTSSGDGSGGRRRDDWGDDLDADVRNAFYRSSV